MKRIMLFMFLSTLLYSKSLTLVTLESPPLEYLEEGIAKGTNIDIVKETLNRMGYSVNIKFVPWKRALLMVKEGLADGIIDAAYTKDRDKYLHYPKEEIHIEEWYAFKKSDTQLTLDENFENAKNISLGVSRGFIYGGKIQKAIENNMFKFLDKTYNNKQNIKKVYAGRFDMFLGVKITILNLANTMGYKDKISIVKMTGTNEEYLLSSSKTYLGFSKKNISKTLVDNFSKGLSQIKKDGTVNKIMKKYN